MFKGYPKWYVILLRATLISITFFLLCLPFLIFATPSEIEYVFFTIIQFMILASLSVVFLVGNFFGLKYGRFLGWLFIDLALMSLVVQTLVSNADLLFLLLNFVFFVSLSTGIYLIGRPSSKLRLLLGIWGIISPLLGFWSFSTIDYMFELNMNNRVIGFSLFNLIMSYLLSMTLFTIGVRAKSLSASYTLNSLPEEVLWPSLSVDTQTSA